MKQVQLHETSTSMKQANVPVISTSTWSKYKGMRQACVQLHETGQLFGTLVTYLINE